MWQMSSQTKAFIDRLFVFFQTKLSSKIKGKKVVLAFSQGNPKEDSFHAYFEHTASMMRFLGFDVVTTIVSSGNNAHDAIKLQKKLLSKAEKIGFSLVK